MSKGWEQYRDLQVEMVVSAGSARLKVDDAVAQLHEGAIIELDAEATEPLRIMLGGRCIARGECSLDGDRVEVRVARIAAHDGDDAAADSDPPSSDRSSSRWAGSST